MDESELNRWFKSLYEYAYKFAVVKGHGRVFEEDLQELAADVVTELIKKGVLLHVLHLSATRDEFLAKTTLTESRAHQPIRLYCPLDITRSLRPPIVWKASPNVRYNVSVLADTDVPAAIVEFLEVTSPIDPRDERWKGVQLDPGRAYKIVISESKNRKTTSEENFKVHPRASLKWFYQPEEKIRRSVQLMLLDPPSYGDMLGHIQTMPPDLPKDPILLRLKLLACAVLGFQEEFLSTRDLL